MADWTDWMAGNYKRLFFPGIIFLGAIGYLIIRLLSGLNGPTSSITAGSAHSCRRTAGGSIECWGQNASGQLGSGSSSQSVLVAAPVTGLSSVTFVSASTRNHTCAIVAGGAVK